MQNKRTFTTLLAVTAGAASLAAAGAPAAQADSIAYVKDGNVWLTTTDGSRQFQVTSTGNAAYVSQADDGTLLATTTGNHLDRLDRMGNVLSDIPTPVSTAGSTLFTFWGPLSADISPDGKNAAYTWWSKGFYTSGSHVTEETHDGTGFTHADALTGFTDDGYKYFKDWDDPEWIDNQTVLVGNGPGYPSNQFAIAKLGTGDPQGWFWDPDNLHPLEPTISRNKRVLAAVVGPDAKGIAVYRDWDGELLGTVSSCFSYGSDGHDGTPTMNSPTLNADGSKLAYSDGHDLMVAPIGDMTKDCPTGVNATDIVAGATSPDWGPADVPTARIAPAPTPIPNAGGQAPGSGQTSTVITNTTQQNTGLTTKGNQPGGTTTPGTTTQPGGTTVGGATAITFTAPGKIKNAAKTGVPFGLHAAAGPLKITAVTGKTVLASKTIKVGASGNATVTLKLSKSVAAKLRAAHHLTIQVTATQGSVTAATSFRI